MCAMMKRDAAERMGNLQADRSYFTTRDSIEFDLAHIRDVMASLERANCDPIKSAHKEANLSG